MRYILGICTALLVMSVVAPAVYELYTHVQTSIAAALRPGK